VARSAIAHPHPPARQQLEIAFDLAAHQLIGKSIITVPAETAVSIYLAGLEITDLALDGAPLRITEQIDIPAGLKDQQVTINFRKVYAAGQMNGIIDHSGITLVGLWHPRLDLDCFQELTASFPAQFTAISEAEEINETLSGETRTVRFRFDHPRKSLNFVAGPYVVEQEPIGPGQTLYSYFFPEDQELAAEYRKKTLGYLKRYQELIGPYPYKRYSIVENRLPTGYAMPTFTLLGQTVVRLPFITETSLGHEVLHSWFGNSIGVDAAQGNWCEGLTTYLADQSFAVDKQTDTAFRKQQLINYQSYVPPDNTMALKDFSSAGSHLLSDNKAARAVGYDKTSMVFHMLRKEIGDAAFYAGLRDLYQKFPGRQASWQDLAATFSKNADKNLELFFEQWLSRADLPRLALIVDSYAEKEGQISLDISIRQLQEKPYQMTLSLEIVTAKGKKRQTVSLSGTETKLTLKLDDYPSLLIADPDYDVMRVLSDEELPPTWSRFLGAREKLAILPAADEERIYAPIIKLLADMDCPSKAADSATDKDLAGKSVIFLGNSGRLARSIFASLPQPAEGFSLEARDNPLAPGQIAVLITSANASETAAATPKLAHYGKYSALSFKQGRAVSKTAADTEQGMRLPLDSPPQGIVLPQALPFSAIMDKLADTKVVFVGESHIRLEDHHLQLRVIRAMFDQNRNLAIGMEMFGREAQPVLDRFVAGELNEREFLKQSEYLSKWGFDYRLYRDIINFARRHHLPIVGLNVPKEIVSKVFKEGTAGLTSEEQAKIPADRDLDIPGYRQRITDIFDRHGQHSASEQLNGFLQAQALWDESMAESVATFLVANPGSRMVVVAGRGHTDRDTAIPPRLARRLPGIRQAVILNSESVELPAGEADYLVFSRPAKLPPPAVLGVMLVKSAEGVQVEGLAEQSKAGAAGIREKDIILALDDEPVASIDDLKINLLTRETGKPVTVRIKRRTGFIFKTEEILSIVVNL